MFADPSKATLLIVLVAANFVAVPALPEMEPVIKLLKISVPDHVFVSPRRVEEAAPEREVKYPALFVH